MKTKNTKKLQLNKETIAGLNSKKLHAVKGGDGTANMTVGCGAETLLVVLTCRSLDEFCQ